MNFKITSIVKTSQIEKTISLYKYLRKKKVVTFVPLKFVDKLMFEMGNAGAGIIGSYDLCSFRMNGLGTYRPGKRAKPFKGNKNVISYEEEVRLEMECYTKDIDYVVDALLANHPYEEPAYEIYDFARRNKLPSGYLYKFKKPVSLKLFINKLSPAISPENISSDIKINSLAVVPNDSGKEACEVASFYGAEYLLCLQKKINLIIKL